MASLTRLTSVSSTRLLAPTALRFSTQANAINKIAETAEKHLVVRVMDGKPTGKYIGRHGTTLDQIEAQAARGEFDDLGRKIYFVPESDFDALSTPMKYAYQSGGWYPRHMFGPLKRSSGYDKKIPVIVTISSDHKPEKNDLKKNPDLHDHFYFPPGSKVKIHDMIALNGRINPEALEQDAASMNKIREVGRFQGIGKSIVQYIFNFFGS